MWIWCHDVHSKHGLRESFVHSILQGEPNRSSSVYDLNNIYVHLVHAPHSNQLELVPAQDGVDESSDHCHNPPHALVVVAAAADVDAHHDGLAALGR